MEGQLRVYISEHNLREEKLRLELASVQKQLEFTVIQNQEIQESVKMLKQDFNVKETKLLSDFSQLKDLKNKLEEKLYTQDQTRQTANMIFTHKKLGDVNSISDLGDPKPMCLRKGKIAQPALYDSQELFRPGHSPPGYVAPIGKKIN